MNDLTPFTKKFSEKEKAVDFASKVGGEIKGNTTVCFSATYSISKALYNVKRNMYKVYIKIRPVTPGSSVLTYMVYSKTSKDAYEIARKKVKSGVL